MNEKKKKIYDSTLEFDDSIPKVEGKIATFDKFFELFNPVFKRNAIWSKKVPVPALGDKTLSYKKV
jgi:hypothetical protein